MLEYKSDHRSVLQQQRANLEDLPSQRFLQAVRELEEFIQLPNIVPHLLRFGNVDDILEVLFDELSSVDIG